MLRLLADENLIGAIWEGVGSRIPDLDFVRVQDAGLMGASDAAVLAWAAEQGRVLITHDRKTVPYAAEARVEAGTPMPGVFVAPLWLSEGDAIEDVLLLAEYSMPGEGEGLVLHLPLDKYITRGSS